MYVRKDDVYKKKKKSGIIHLKGKVASHRYIKYMTLEYKEQIAGICCCWTGGSQHF